ncbi:pseudouridine-5'-phosphate glycosidase [Dermacoccus sp. Tok2021]|uniref:pseudouridine-5'-phosphate glycosidase n=1 Tax=Dermacoccus sp. Tok2021 TaxID=2826873 RepID=UPI001CA797A4|nr:pseudouridine-5'-phosphate glycosidase [Dermacoccus sp. Tok2021]MBZ4498874.1 pseudouridine-5'-phosphate glycosidase [Dermacoccus sp. Tok2021]
MTEPIRISAEVRDALAEGRPVVALESTIFTHGLPRPRNLEVALEGEAIVRDAGAVPATIGVFHGESVVGLSEDEITELSKEDGLLKASIRELAYAKVKGLSAGTTIAATAYLANRAGIDVFATGGLGGVHHGAEKTFDESADLVAMSRTSFVLVSSGAKAILDIAATLERFETLSVPVVGYRTNSYPGFYVQESGYTLNQRVDSPQEVAAMLREQRALGMTSGVNLANPVPVDEQLDPEGLDAILEQAWADAEKDGISGQASTPYLLDYIRRATNDRSLDANVALYRNNIKLATQVAAAMVE